jgi:cell division protein FtsL
MKRLVATLCLFAATGAAVFLFHIKHQVRLLESELADTHAAILRHQEAIQVLASEWSYLNQPARLADLAERHLDYAPISAERIVRFDDLPVRAASEHSATPALAEATKARIGAVQTAGGPQ